jgi:stage II sporulation protein D
MDQVFSLTESKKAYAAVLETQNVFLLDQNQKILRAFYHSDCGGQTLPASLVWPGTADSGTAKDPWCSTRETNRWQIALSRSEFEASQAIQIKKFKNKIVEVAGLSVQKIRETFGFNLVRNAPTNIQLIDDTIVLLGQGYGHGAGLCQYGTFAQSKLGRSYVDIIKHYYPKAILSDSPLKLAHIKNNHMNDLTFKL